MDSTLQISSLLVERIVAEASASRDEVCGLLLGCDGIVTEVRPCRNVHSMPATRFELDPVALFAALRGVRAGGPQVLGHYHSHPSGVVLPSATDAADAAPDGTFWLIVAGDVVAAWRAVSDGAVHGRFDPVTLAIAR
ncbi:M67 family metallopeptidase [Sphingomonas radiodurans]|uniref:M67 family metallopeptidase n=1 Tax=Sphingomonas radiodurans TaxID=2890321 RepID=UPI001E5E304F|nr:M67 family metallopeptidase [Sphingomonas radiodurans]WBH16076.1 M67 family metallopeptidase [Sphingomonas radiodurans]